VAQEAAAKAAGDAEAARRWRQRAAEQLDKVGVLYTGARSGAKAEPAFRQALQLDPENASIPCHYGDLLVQIGRLTEAEPLYRKAVALDPGLARAHNNLASLLKEFGQTETAEASFRRALELDPDLPEAAYALSSNKLMALNYRADVSAEEVFRAHRDWGAALIARQTEPTPGFANDPDPDRVLRVGYVSPDLRQHSITYFLESLLANHDRAAVETFGYAEVAHPDAVTERFKALTSQWRFTAGMSDAELRHQVREDRIDILVDLAGHTSRTRIAAFAVRPAPVTATWLGYPATSGLATVDYRFTDGIADPPGAADKLHTETLVRLPHGFLCYHPPTDAPEPGPTPAIAKGAVTFGSFNNLAKVTPEVIETWARLLQGLPAARLLLKGWIFADAVLRRRMTDRFAALGVAAERIDLRPLIPGVAEHLRLYREIDIGLDPFPYNGTTTTCEALWMGVPVVTLVGDRHAARVGVSLLARVGLERLAAGDVESYVATAVELARDVAALNEIRLGLRDRMRRSPLMDAPRFARDVEAAYRTMWRAWCARRTG
jgi:predicted O-linked N-acetylglucosamine transferase (SPINDLY family)